MRHMSKASDAYLRSADVQAAFPTPQRSSVYAEIAILQISPNLRVSTWKHLYYKQGNKIYQKD